MNPFDDDAAEFAVLANDRQEYCLWPAFAALPDGWRQELGPVDRTEAMEFIDRNWVDPVLFPTA